MILAGYMVPHPPIAVHEIGNGEETKIQATIDGFDTVARDIARLKPETIILTSPHSVMYRDYFHISPGHEAFGSFGAFRAGNVQIHSSYDYELVEEICRLSKEKDFPAGCMGERNPELDHGTMVPLYFITKHYKQAMLVRIGLSGLPLEKHVEFGQIISEAVASTKRRCVFIASGDLSHCQKTDGPYGYRPQGPLYDEKIMEVMGRGDFSSLTEFDEKLLDASMECGHRSFTIMGGAFKDIPIESKLLSHEATFGVGYGICMYHPK